MPDGGQPLEVRRRRISMLPKQLEGLADTTSKIIIYRGGYRSGKTVFLIAKAIDLGLRNWPHPILVVMPSFNFIRSVFVKEAMKLCISGDRDHGVEPWGFSVRWQESKKILTIGSRRPVQLICRSADAPRSIEGLTVAGLVGDEWELWDIDALKVAMARVSIGRCPQIVLGGTPEGFGPGYQLLERNKPDSTNVIVVKTKDNPYITKDYVADQSRGFSEQEIAEKLEGERTMPANRVYTRFRRDLHARVPCIKNPAMVRLEVWCNFNPLSMVWPFVLVDDVHKCFHVVGELVREGTDSQMMAAAAAKWIVDWKRANGLHPEHRGTRAVMDARGRERAPLSHVVNLEQAGFVPKFAAQNPGIDDLVTSVQVVLGGPSSVGGFWPVRLTVDPAASKVTMAMEGLQRGPNGLPVHDQLFYAASAINYGVMWHAPAFAPGPNNTAEMKRVQWEAWVAQGSGR